MSTSKYYALWHDRGDDCKSAAAISENPYVLLALHEEHIKNPDSCYHNYKDVIEEIKVEPIECYTYVPEIHVFEPYCDRDAAEDHAFYAFNCLPTKEFDESGEVLIYLSTSVHAEWIHHSEQYQAHLRSESKNIPFDVGSDTELPTSFYTDSWPSHDPVEPDVYYEEGIMNA